MSDYLTFARDLRLVADLFEAKNNDLPLPQYPGQGLSIGIHTKMCGDVEHAAREIGVTCHRERTGHTTAEFSIGTVHLSFVHVDDATMADHRARQAYARSMPVTP